MRHTIENRESILIGSRVCFLIGSRGSFLIESKGSFLIGSRGSFLIGSKDGLSGRGVWPSYSSRAKIIRNKPIRRAIKQKGRE